MKFVYSIKRTSYENFKLNFWACAQTHALDTGTKFQLEILTTNVISGIAYFRAIILGCSQNVTETTPWVEFSRGMQKQYRCRGTFFALTNIGQCSTTALKTNGTFTKLSSLAAAEIGIFWFNQWLQFRWRDFSISVSVKGLY